jgi:tRNA(Ile)-lysidine synthase
VPAASRTHPDTPIAEAEAARLFEPLNRFDHVALAISGGSDSTALMLLAARARGRGDLKPRLTVLTVDHGLRPEAAAEARQVAAWACALDLPSHVLTWQGMKPSTGIQAAARTARYALMRAWCAAHGAEAIVTAHTLEDQAETLLMRLARASGLQGLAAMQPERREPWPLVRPLLAVSRQRLRATLADAGHPFIDDPSNDDPRFERVRLRHLKPVLAETGLSDETLAAVARRLARANAAVEAQVRDTMAAAVFDEGLGLWRIRRAALAAAPEEVRIRLLQAVAGWAGGQPEPLDLASAESVSAWLDERGSGRRTVGGALIEAGPDDLRLCREPGRISRAGQAVAPGQSFVFDHRFVVSVAPGWGADELTVRPVAGLERPPRAPAGLWRPVWETLPCLTGPGDRLLWAPGGEFAAPVTLQNVWPGLDLTLSRG